MLKLFVVGILGLIMRGAVSPAWGQGSGHSDPSHHSWHPHHSHANHLTWQQRLHQKEHQLELERQAIRFQIEQERRALRHHQERARHHSFHHHTPAPHSDRHVVIHHPAAPLFFLGGLLTGLAAH